jgi:hypothetical protein
VARIGDCSCRCRNRRARRRSRAPPPAPRHRAGGARASGRDRERADGADERRDPRGDLLRAGLAEGAALRRGRPGALRLLRGARDRGAPGRQADRRHLREGTAPPGRARAPRPRQRSPGAAADRRRRDRRDRAPRAGCRRPPLAEHRGGRLRRRRPGARVRDPRGGRGDRAWVRGRALHPRRRLDPARRCRWRDPRPVNRRPSPSGAATCASVPDAASPSAPASIRSPTPSSHSSAPT